METKYQEYYLQEVLDYFARDFEFKDGERVVDSFVDTAQSKVIYKLLVKEKKNEN